MVKWEYRIVAVDQNDSTQRLNAEKQFDVFGEHGWELVAVTTPHASSWLATAYFKRVKE